MITKSQAKHLRKLIRYYGDKCEDYYLESERGTHTDANSAEQAMSDADKKLNDYISTITETLK